MYIPSAGALTYGGFFQKRQDADAWDTLLSAQHILKSVHDAHKAQLAALPRALGGAKSGSLLDLAVAGLATEQDGRLAVESCLALRDELIAASSKVPVLFVVDNYNSLYWTTDYGVALSPRHRRLLKVEELPLATGFRLLEQGTGNAAVVCGMSHSARVSPKMQIPLQHGAERYWVPRYDAVELAHVLTYYHEKEATPDIPSEDQVRSLLALTNGNGAEVRKHSVRISVLDMHAA